MAGTDRGYNSLLSSLLPQVLGRKADLGLHEVICIQYSPIRTRGEHGIQIMLVEHVATGILYEESTHVAVLDVGEVEYAKSTHEVVAICIVFNVPYHLALRG
jgi:hypothetical protein